MANERMSLVTNIVHGNYTKRLYTKKLTQNSFATIYTRKNAQVVTNLPHTCSNVVPTTCQQDVFALLDPSLLTSCYKVIELNRLVTS